MIPYLVLKAAEGVRAEAGTLVEPVGISSGVTMETGSGVTASTTRFSSRGTARALALRRPSLVTGALVMPFPGAAPGGRAPPRLPMPASLISAYPPTGLRLADVAS